MCNAEVYEASERWKDSTLERTPEKACSAPRLVVKVVQCHCRSSIQSGWCHSHSRCSRGEQDSARLRSLVCPSPASRQGLGRLWYFLLVLLPSKSFISRYELDMWTNSLRSIPSCGWEQSVRCHRLRPWSPRRGHRVLSSSGTLRSGGVGGMLRVGLLYDRRPEGTAVTELESVIPFSETIKPRGIVGDQFRHCRDFVVTVHRSRPDLKTSPYSGFPRNVVQAELPLPLFHAD
jgi:hypothetical protein